MSQRNSGSDTRVNRLRQCVCETQSTVLSSAYESKTLNKNERFCVDLQVAERVVAQLAAELDVRAA
jgi:hypothetical protein